MLILIIIFGLICGSFISALTWRLPRGMNFVNDRSRCDNCDYKLKWYDNIPLISWLLLGGKCRNCGRKISARYPLIEAGTAMVFFLIYIFTNVCGHISFTAGNSVCSISNSLNSLFLIYLFFIAVLMISVFVTDIELQVIPDQFVFLMLGVQIIFLILFLPSGLFESLFSGFLISVFLLILHFITKGRGMGLGDVKLAIFAGIFFGLKFSITWMFTSFISGAFIGLLLMAFNKAKFGQKIAFGPFLVLSFFIILFWGDKISSILLPYL